MKKAPPLRRPSAAFLPPLRRLFAAFFSRVGWRPVRAIGYLVFKEQVSTDTEGGAHLGPRLRSSGVKSAVFSMILEEVFFIMWF